ncbi:hypothetical protein GW626_18485 [Peribacillus muralis]|uniref:hypothetical protein n=1 Tax=Peribacillus muralis TaxID=264697 RepID=UPI001F4D5498|nr:hypothetical protein [Peribacillus muralis]MCK1992344.1 hypothetical protein [Peribacillus muralis]MCK2012900.1 hypothetical protein [Peribacillus muralis]
MFSLKKITVGLLILGSLVACEKEQVKHTEKVDTQEGLTKEEPTETNRVPSYEAPKYHIYGGWVTDKTYIVISSNGDGLTYENIKKKNEKKDIRYLKLAESTGHKLIAVSYSKEKTNRTSFITLDLNKERTELTITMPNEKPVTYTKAMMDPEEFNPEFEW